MDGTDHKKLEVVAAEICAARQLTLGAPVGSGAFKATFRVIDSSGSPIALKVCRPNTSTDRPAREIDAMRKCSDNRIARLHDFGVHPSSLGSSVYMLEEFLDGGTLSSLLGQGPLATGKVRSIGIDLAEALGHIAMQRLVHRDLKPDNVMFRSGGPSPVIVDFGLVRNLDATSLTQTWATMGPGTPLFASPEQLNNEKALIDWRSDQFSLAITLYWCATGRHPFEHVGDTQVNVVERVMQRQRPDPRFIDFCAKEKFGTLLRMTALWPASRFRTATQLIDSMKKEAA